MIPQIIRSLSTVNPAMQTRESQRPVRRSVHCRSGRALEGSIGHQSALLHSRDTAWGRSALRRGVGVLAAILSIAARHQTLADDIFASSNGDWFVGSNWQNGSVPAAGDSVWIYSNDTATISSAGAMAANLFVGGYGANSGSLVVTGLGTLTLSAGISMYGGGGTLLVQNGGTVNVSTPSGQGSTLGASSGSDTVTITGAGSSFNFSGGGLLQLGGVAGNTTNVTISAGGLFSASGSVSIGSFGTCNLTVTGANSKFTSTSSLSVGQSNTNTSTITINGGGQISDAGAVLGVYAAQASVTVSDTGSRWDNTGSVFVGTANTNTGGSVLVQNGAAGSSGSLSLGVQNGLAATFTLTGAGSSWLNSGALTVSANPLAAFTVSAGGALTSNGTASLNSDFTVTDAGSTWNNPGTTTISGTGVISILNGATATTGPVYITQNAANTVSVSGLSTSWSAGAMTVSDASGTATALQVSGGASLTSTGLTVSSGNVRVTGSGSSLSSTGGTSIGSGTGASITVDSGGLFTTGGTATVTWYTPSSGSVTVTGTGSTWNANTIQIGQSGVGTVNVTAGGLITSSNLSIGLSNYTGSQGTVIVDGSGSRFNAGNLVVGSFGPAYLTVSSGGLLQSQTSVVGGPNGGTGNITITDPGSQWLSPAAALGISNGSILTVANGGSLVVGNGTGTISLNSFSSIGGYNRLNIGSGGLAGSISASSIASEGIISFNFTDSLNFGIPISGNGSLTKAGSGTLTLSAANSFHGGVTATGGAVRATNPSAFGTGPMNFSNTALTLAYDTGSYFNGDPNYPPSVTFGTDTTITSDRNTAGPGVTHGLGVLYFNGTTLTVNAGTNVTSGVAGLTFVGTVFSGNPTVNVGSNAYVLLNSYSGANIVTKTGPGTLELGSTSVTGTSIVVNGGTLQEEAAVNSTRPAAVTVNATVPGVNANYNLDNINHAVLSLTLGGAGGSSTSANSVDTGDSTLLLNGNLVFDATSNPLGSTISGALDFNGTSQTVTVGHSANAPIDLAISADILGGVFTKNGPGTLQLSGNNYFCTGIILAAGQLLATGQANAVGGGTLTMSGGSLQLAYDNNVTTSSNLTLTTDASITSNRVTPGAGASTTFTLLTMGAQTLTLSAGTNVTSGTSGLVFNYASLSGTASINTGAGTQITLGIVADGSSAGGLIKSGPGTIVMIGLNRNTGTTEIDAGKIIVSGSLSGSLWVEASAIAASAHNLTAAASNVSVMSTDSGGGSLAPGDTGGTGTSSIGRLTISGGLTLGSLSTAGKAHLTMELGGLTAGTQYDQIVLKGTLSLADVTLDASFVNGFTASPGSEFFLITGATTPIAGIFSNQLAPDANSFGFPTLLIGSQEFAISYQANAAQNSLTGGRDIALLAIVPEPACGTLLLAGGLLCGIRRRKRAG